MKLQIYLKWDAFCWRVHYLAGQMYLQVNIYHQWEMCHIEEEFVVSYNHWAELQTLPPQTLPRSPLLPVFLSL